jgi:glutamate synthase (NADPH/NADH) small chain
MPKPPVGRRNYALAILAFAVKTSSSHEEGCRNWLINTKEFISNDKGELVGLKTVEVDWKMTRTKTRISREKKDQRKLGLRFSAIGPWFYRTRKPKQSIRIRT